MKSFWKWAAVTAALLPVIFVIDSVGLSSLAQGQAQWTTMTVSQAGAQAQPAWNIQSVAQGPDAAKQRVAEPDVAVTTDGKVYVSYIDQKANAIKLLQVGGATAELVRDTGRVAGTTVAATDTLVCVSWEELSDSSGVHEVWQACWNADLSPAGEPLRLSTEGIIAGQANGAGWQEFGFNFDNTFAPDGTLYAVWSEDYAKLKAGKYKDGAVSACGEFPPVPIPDAPIRYPTVYVDSAGGVWVASADISYPPGPNIWIWYSDDQCASWKGPVDSTPTGLYSDGPGIVRLGDKIYQVNDDDAGAAPGTADIHVNICDATSNGAANCVRNVVHQDGGFPHIATDGKGMYVASYDGNANAVKFSYSCNAAGSWTPADIPNKWNSGYRDPDFGAMVSRVRVATSAGSTNVYVAWFWRSEGKSNIMLGTLTKPCQ